MRNETEHFCKLAWICVFRFVLYLDTFTSLWSWSPRITSRALKQRKKNIVVKNNGWLTINKICKKGGAWRDIWICWTINTQTEMFLFFCYIQSEWFQFNLVDHHRLAAGKTPKLTTSLLPALAATDGCRTAWSTEEPKLWVISSRVTQQMLPEPLRQVAGGFSAVTPPSLHNSPCTQLNTHSHISPCFPFYFNELQHY